MRLRSAIPTVRAHAKNPLRNQTMTPNDRKYAKTHEWVKIEGDVAIVGITDHAQHELGDVTYLEIKPVGTALARSRECGVIESVQAASDLYAPIGGTVAEINDAAVAKPELINKDPYGKGWILKIKGFNAAEAASLLDATGYESSVAQG
jgi:glycine cleavage system H protein